MVEFEHLYIKILKILLQTSFLLFLYITFMVLHIDFGWNGVESYTVVYKFHSNDLKETLQIICYGAFSLMGLKITVVYNPYNLPFSFNIKIEIFVYVP